VSLHYARIMMFVDLKVARAEGGVNGRPASNLPIAIPRSLRKRMTDHEVKLWNWLREDIKPIGFHFRRQVPIGRFVVDFACLKAKLVVEVDGVQHALGGLDADIKRDAVLAKMGFRVLRFWNGEIDHETAMVLDTIHAALVESASEHRA
jgi:very-short-patch-repair endonuclease